MLSPFSLLLWDVVVVLVVELLSTGLKVEACGCHCGVVLVWVLLVVEDKVEDDCVVIEGSVADANGGSVCTVLCVVV